MIQLHVVLHGLNRAMPKIMIFSFLTEYPVLRGNASDYG